MAYHDSTYFEVKIGEEPTDPGLQIKLEVILGGGSFDDALEVISSRIGDFAQLKVYVVFQATSAESAQEVATVLTAEWASISSGSEAESVLSELIPMLKPDPEGPELVDLYFSAFNDLVVLSGSPNEDLSFQAAAVVEMCTEQASAILANEQGIKLEVNSGASFSEILHSDKPVLDLLTSFKARFDLSLNPSTFVHAEQIASNFGTPPEFTHALKVAGLYQNAHLVSHFRTLAELPSGVRDKIQGTDALSKAVIADMQRATPADRRVLTALAEHTSGSMAIYATAGKALVKLHLIAKGASDLLRSN